MPRKQKKYHYIYKTTCQMTGKFYVGMHSTDDLDDGYLGSGKILGYSIGKHGRENHKKEILEFLPDRAALKAREAEVVNEELLADPLCINLKYGGEGGWDHTRDDPKCVLARNQALAQGRTTMWADDEYRKKHSARSSENMKQRWKLGAFKKPDAFTMSGKSHSLESREKMSLSHLKEKNSQFGTCWVTNGTPIKIKKEQLDEYLAHGYRRGRKTPE